MRVIFTFAGSKVVKECRTWQGALEIAWLLRPGGLARNVWEPLADLTRALHLETFGEGL